jgi:hypothetical protein
MIILRNDRLIKRNARIAQITMLGGLAVLGIGMYVSFRYPEQVSISLTALLLGFLFSQIGIYYANRWGRSPRPDQLIDQALKGLDKKFTLYHFLTPAAHLLVGPAGVWILMPYYQRGKITYENGRWKQHGGGFFQVYMRIFAQEGLGRPDLELVSELDTMNKYFEKRLPGVEPLPVEAALVFTHPQAVVEIPEGEEPPAATVTLKDLKETIKKAAKGKVLSVEKAQLIQDALLPEGKAVKEEV